MNQSKTRTKTGALWKCLFLVMMTLTRGMLVPGWPQIIATRRTFDELPKLEQEYEKAGGDMSLTTDTTRDDYSDQNHHEGLAAKTVRFGGGEELAFLQDDPWNILCELSRGRISVVTIPDDHDDPRSLALAKILRNTFRGEQVRSVAQTLIDLLEKGDIEAARDMAGEIRETGILGESPELKALIIALDVEILLAEAYVLLLDLQSLSGRGDARAALVELDDALNKHKVLHVDKPTLLKKARAARDAAKIVGANEPGADRQKLLQLEACLDEVMVVISSMQGPKKNVDLNRTDIGRITKAIRLAQDLATALELPFESVTARLLESRKPEDEKLKSALQEAEALINSQEKGFYVEAKNHPLPGARCSLSEAAQEALKILTADEISTSVTHSDDHVKAAYRHLVDKLEKASRLQ